MHDIFRRNPVYRDSLDTRLPGLVFPEYCLLLRTRPGPNDPEQDILIRAEYLQMLSDVVFETFLGSHRDGPEIRTKGWMETDGEELEVKLEDLKLLRDKIYAHRFRPHPANVLRAVNILGHPGIGEIHKAHIIGANISPHQVDRKILVSLFFASYSMFGWAANHFLRRSYLCGGF